mgnify:CR=1 FL=1
MRLDLFLISLLTLFLELTCIRWFPSHVLFLTFFTNTVLLASILGIAVGCLAANRKSNLLLWTPLILIVGARQRAPGRVAAADHRRASIDVGNQASPQMVFFGVEYQARDLSSFVIPIEALCGYFFLVIALAMMGPGQQLGRCLARIPNRLEAYTIDILGSIAGIVALRRVFVPRAAADVVVRDRAWPASRGSSSPDDRRRGVRARARAGAGAGAVGRAAGARAEGPRQMWSPYYRIDYQPADRLINVNLIGHQQMQPRDAAFPGLRAAAPAQSRCRRQAVRPGADHRRRIGQRRQPRARVGRRRASTRSRSIR